MLDALPQELWGVVGFLLLLVLIFLRVPVAIAMASVGIGGSLLFSGLKPVGLTFAAAALESVFPYALSVIPLFVLMGVFVTHAELSRKLYDGMHALVGHRPGGLAQTTIAACGMFGAICGSSLATAATMTRVALPQMQSRNYSDQLATGSIAAGGTLGILIPPSVILLIYGILTGTSIGKLFVAGIIPGLIAIVFYMMAVRFVVWRDPDSGPADKKAPFFVRIKKLIGIWDVFLLFGLVLGGIYGGWFSTTEAAAIGAFGGLIAAIARKRSIRFLPVAMEEAAKTTAMIFLIIVGTAAFNGFIERTELPNALIEFVTQANLNSMTIVIFLMIAYLLLGCFMDGLSVIFVTIPVVYPLIAAFGIDPVWFGILVVCATEIGLITPPIGMNLFVIKGLSRDITIQAIWRGAFPFVVADIMRLTVLLAFPILTLYLPAAVR